MAKISVVGLAAGAAELVAAAGASAVVGDLVKAVTPYDASRFHKIMVGIGGYAIGGVLSDLSARYIRSQIETYAEKLKDALHPVIEPDEDTVVLPIEDDGEPGTDYVDQD